MNWKNVSTKETLSTGFVAGYLADVVGLVTTNAVGGGPVQIFATVAMVFTICAGAWLGYLRGSARSTAYGALVGLCIGAAYFVVAVIANLHVGFYGPGFPFMYFITIPCLLNGLFLGLFSYDGSKFTPLFLRFFTRGVVTGALFGALHLLCALAVLITLSNAFRYLPFISPNSPLVPALLVPISLGVAGAAYFRMTLWALKTDGEKGILKWAEKLSMWKVGLAMFGLMSVIGAVWSFLH